MTAIDELTESFLEELRRGCKVKVYDEGTIISIYYGPTAAQIGARLMRREEAPPEEDNHANH